MKDNKNRQSIRKRTNEVSNKSYLDLLEKYIMIDKTEDLDNKHREWCRSLTE